jgi:hypothetical protein
MTSVVILHKSAALQILDLLKGRTLPSVFNSDDRFWFCHNDSEFNGDRSPDRLGYGYSWAFSIYNDEPSDEVDILNMTNTSGLKLDTTSTQNF